MAKRVSRREKLEKEGIRRRGSKESGFHYAWPDGKRVHDADLLDRIQALRIPPAWKEVRIAPRERSVLQAIGVDSKKRTQYRYHERFRQRREREKFLRIVHFAEALPSLRRRVARDLSAGDLSRETVLAAAVRLIDQGFFRLGNDRSAREEDSYGLSTILPEHVRVEGDVIHFEFTGKWGKNQRRAVKDRDVAAIVRKLASLGDGELLKFDSRGRLIDVKDRHINQYIQSIIGEQFSAKDFRTWAGTVICASALAMMEQKESGAARKRQVVRAVKATAEVLGNTPAVCRSSYICPQVVEDYRAGRSFERLKKAHRGKIVARTRLSKREKALLAFLRETIADRRREERSS
jgi:DNA topoisomerase I